MRFCQCYDEFTLMPTIAKILNDSEKGLLPYLERKLQNNWGRFQIRNWAFLDTDDNSSGFRLRESSSQQTEFDNILKSWTVTLGKVITIDDPVESQLLCGTLSEQIDDAIYHWANGVCNWLEVAPGQTFPITSIDGMNDIEPNRRISSENPGAWNVIAIREFRLFYHMDYEAC
jgi:hypothetical protein